LIWDWDFFDIIHPEFKSVDFSYIWRGPGTNTDDFKMDKMQNLKGYALALLLTAVFAGCGGGGQCPIDLASMELKQVSFYFDHTCYFQNGLNLTLGVTSVETNTTDCDWRLGSMVIARGTYVLNEWPADKIEPLHIWASFAIGNAKFETRDYFSCADPLKLGAGEWVSVSEITGLEAGGTKHGLNLELDGVGDTVVCELNTCL